MTRRIVASIVYFQSNPRDHKGTHIYLQMKETLTCLQIKFSINEPSQMKLQQTNQNSTLNS